MYKRQLARMVSGQPQSVTRMHDQPHGSMCERNIPRCAQQFRTSFTWLKTHIVAISRYPALTGVLEEDSKARIPRSVALYEHAIPVINVYLLFL